jgi:hypothetical protein
MKASYVGLVIIGILLVGINYISGEDLSSELSSAIQNQDTDKVREAVRKISGLNNEKGIKIILDTASKIRNDDEAYWPVLLGLQHFTDEVALNTLCDFIISKKAEDIGNNALVAIKDNNSPTVVNMLINVLEKGSAQQQRTIVEQNLSGSKTRLKASTLINFLKSPACEKNSDLRKLTIDELQLMLGQSIGQTTESINQWWEKHKNDEESVLFNKGQATITTDSGTVADGYVKIERIRKSPKDKIIVVISDCKGCESIGKKPPDWDHNFDHIEFILDRMNIPHTVIKKSDFDKEDYKLNDKWVVIFNCNYIIKHCICPTCKLSNDRGGLRSGSCAPGCTQHTYTTNMLSEKGVTKVKEFVANGGYLFSEDWILVEVLERAFKGIISKRVYYTKEKKVTILPGPSAITHPYLKGVFDKPHKSEVVENEQKQGEQTVSMKKIKIGEGKWKIDKDSPDIRIDKPSDVTVLMVAPKLKATDKDSGAVAVTFSYGKGGTVARISGGNEDPYASSKRVGGQVLHVLSHFGHQEDPTDEFALQNMILNFITEAVEKHK